MPRSSSPSVLLELFGPYGLLELMVHVDFWIYGSIWTSGTPGPYGLLELLVHVDFWNSWSIWTSITILSKTLLVESSLVQLIHSTSSGPTHLSKILLVESLLIQLIHSTSSGPTHLSETLLVESLLIQLIHSTSSGPTQSDLVVVVSPHTASTGLLDHRLLEYLVLQCHSVLFSCSHMIQLIHSTSSGLI